MSGRGQGERLRVLFVNRMLCLERGGGETFDLEISRVLHERFGVEVEYLSGAPAFGRAPKALAGATCLRTPWLKRFPWDRVKGGWRVRQAEFEWFERRAARWIAEREGRWDVIQICELPELVHWLKAKGTKTPVVMRMTAPNYYDRLGGAKEADALVASGMSIETMRARGVEAADVPNAVDTERFRPAAGPEEKAAARREWGIGEGAFAVVYPARMQGFKDHRTLLVAWADVAGAVKGATLLLAGDGPLRDPLEVQAAELGLGKSVRFLGEVPNERLPGLLRAADAGVISSEYESFCFAAIEMMATGLPVATTDCGWVPRLVEDGAGLIVPVKGAKELAGALEKLAGNEALRARMGATARHLAETRHAWPASAEKLLAVYRKVVGPLQPETRR